MAKVRTGLIAALDIGTTKVCCLIAHAHGDGAIRRWLDAETAVPGGCAYEGWSFAATQRPEDGLSGSTQIRAYQALLNAARHLTS